MTIAFETVWARLVETWLEGKKFLGLSTVLVHVHIHISQNFDKTINPDSRSFLNASYRSLLRSYILSPLSSPPSPALIQLLESPRVTFLDLSYLDDDSGTSLLHEAARRKDLRLIELTVRAGADVFVRNRKGKMAHEGAGKDDRVKVFLRQCMSYVMGSLTFIFIFF